MIGELEIKEAGVETDGVEVEIKEALETKDPAADQDTGGAEVKNAEVTAEILTDIAIEVEIDNLNIAEAEVGTVAIGMEVEVEALRGGKEALLCGTEALLCGTEAPFCGKEVLLCVI